MKLRRWQKVLVVLIALLGAGALVAYLVFREPPPDTRFTGAYVLEDGRRMYVTPREGDVLRYRLEDGESGALFPAGELRYESGPGWSGREPVELDVTFRLGADGRPEGLTWRHVGDRAGAALEARPLDLPEEVLAFRSGEVALHGKLVLPSTAGAGPHPAVVLIHGSEAYSAVDHYFQPYLFAAHGVATLAYDKRGTGDSEGKYTQNFHVLARDVIAAVEALRARPDIDPARIHLHGGSQGGWIAPLAAAGLDEMEGSPGIQSLLIGYGPMVPIVDEDRWGYVYELRRKGFGEEAVARADAIHETVIAIVDHGEWERWDELGRMLDEAEGEPWFEALAGSDSTLGFLAETWMPRWLIKLYAKWKLGQTVAGEPLADRLYDPVPVVASLDVPSLWIFGGEDSSMPTDWSVAELERLQEAGRPIEIVVFPEAEHGILRFEEGEGGERRYLGYEPDYLRTMVHWLRERSGLERSAPAPPRR